MDDSDGSIAAGQVRVFDSKMIGFVLSMMDFVPKRWGFVQGAGAAAG